MFCFSSKKYGFTKAILTMGIAFGGILLSTTHTAFPISMAATSGTVQVQATISGSMQPINDVTNLIGIYQTSPEQILLSWIAPVGPFDNYILTYRKQGDASFSSLGTIDASLSTFSFSTTQPGTTYEFLLKVQRGSNTSAGVNTFTTVPFTSNVGSPTPTPVGVTIYAVPPPILTSIQGTHTTIELHWKEGAPLTYPLTQYEIFRSTEDLPFPSEPYRTFSVSTTSYIDTDIQNNTTYRYFVRAKDIHDAYSGNSNILSFTPTSSTPDSRALPLPEIQNTLRFPIPFIFHDINSVQTVELFYARDGGTYQSFEKIEVIDSLQSGRFIFDASNTGGEGRYTFYTIARNNAGGIETAPSLPDANTLLDITPPPLPIAHGITSTSENICVTKISLQDPGENVQMIIGTSLQTSAGESSTVTLQSPIKWSPDFLINYTKEGLKPISITYVDHIGNVGPTLFLKETCLFPTKKTPITPIPPIVLPNNPLLPGIDTLHGSAQDTDKDGVSDMNELTIYHSSPFDPSSTPPSLDVFTTNIENGMTIPANSDVMSFGAVHPNKEITVYLKNKEGMTLVGTTVSSSFHIYDALLQTPDKDATYDMVFIVKDTITGEMKEYVKKQIHIQKSLLPFIPTFEKIEETTIQELNKALNTETKIRTLSVHPNYKLEETFFRDTVTIKGSLLSLTAPSSYTLIALWDKDYPAADGYVASLTHSINNTFSITSPSLALGVHTLSLYALDEQNVMSPLRTLTFTISPTMYTSPNIPFLLSCPPVYLIPNFWLWILVAFITGILFCLLLRQHEKPKEEKESPEEPEDDIKKKDSLNEAQSPDAVAQEPKSKSPQPPK